MELDGLQSDHVGRLVWRRGFFAHLGAADWGIVPQFGVWVLWVIFQPYLSRRFNLHVLRLVSVGEIHEIVG